MLETARTGSLTVVTDDTFASVVLAADRPVVVDFWAEWCPPCTAISRSLAELAEEFAGRMIVATLDTDENPETTRAHGVMSLPTLLVFHRGEVVGSIVGARPKHHLRQSLSRHLAG
ncbi:thioredoxin [Micromonospora endolithica]|uniref:Thioredoxin n=1 Tax=Micromonospora endolithica TaxID=230091 RepID=A0A3A9ZMB0_9ACTN|nr:thioredoxin [Micromonospora endolithica]RKN48467.1 thioredoxin [Micromonospora endolithica]TWJ24449.1 thioredoxin [Micromonospora endolithica]